MAKSCSAGQVASYGFPGSVYSYITLGNTEGFRRHRELYILSEAHPSSLVFLTSEPLLCIQSTTCIIGIINTPPLVSQSVFFPLLQKHGFSRNTILQKGTRRRRDTTFEDQGQPLDLLAKRRHPPTDALARRAGQLPFSLP